MGESTLKTLDDVMFVQGETPVNQENWQKYFGGVLPNGIYEGFAPKTDYEGELVNEITAGVAVYNGLVYRMASSFAVDRDVPESNGYRLISLRIYPDTGVAKLVETRGNAPVSSDETILNGIIQMTQNPVVSGRDSDQNSYVDYRLVYQGHKNSLYKAGVDLRQPALMRNGKFSSGWHTYWNWYETYKTSTRKAILSGNEVNYYVAPRTDWSFEVWLDPMNPPDNAKLVTNAKYVYFHEYPAIVDVARLGSRIDTPEEFYGIKDEFRNIIECFGTNWDRQTITKSSQIYNPPVVWRYHDATPERPFVIQYRGNNGYSQNMFLIQMPTDGASTEWGLVEGTLSNQQDLQEALDAKADATAVYTKTESDTRMYTKTETDALLDAKANTSDVYTKSETGEIVSNYYTKTESDTLLDAKADSADVYAKTETYTKSETDALLSPKANSADVYAKTETYTMSETDALLSPKANSADVYAKSETYSKSEAYSKSEVDTALSSKANSSSVYTKSETDTKLSTKEDKSALGSLAYKSGLSYDALSNKPTLGALSRLDAVTLDKSTVQGVLPISKGGTGVSSNAAFYDKVFTKEDDVYFYVSISGDDSNDGQTNQSALRTIARAIEKIGSRQTGTIQLVYASDLGQTFREADLYFAYAGCYRLIIPIKTRIIADSISVLSRLRIEDSVRISSPISVYTGGVLSQNFGEITLTVDGTINVFYSSCFLSNIVSNADDNAFNVYGGILTYKSLTGTYKNIGRALNGGIISTGNGHILS